MNILTAYLLISLLSGIAIYCIRKYDLWKYGECVELPDGSIVYSKSLTYDLPQPRRTDNRRIPLCSH